MDERTKALFTDAERSAERVVDQLRMAAVLSLGTVFVIMVVTHVQRDEAVLAVQIPAVITTLAAYLVLGALSYHLAVPRRFRPWMPWAFVTASPPGPLSPCGGEAADVDEHHRDGLAAPLAQRRQAALGQLISDFGGKIVGAVRAAARFVDRTLQQRPHSRGRGDEDRASSDEHREPHYVERLLAGTPGGWARDLETTVGSGAIEIGIGLHAGDAFCGAVGDETRLEFTVLGDTVNGTAELEQETKAVGLRLVVSRNFLAAAGETVDGREWQPLGSRTLRGRARPIDSLGAQPFRQRSANDE